MWHWYPYNLRYNLRNVCLLVTVWLVRVDVPVTRPPRQCTVHPHTKSKSIFTINPRQGSSRILNPSSHPLIMPILHPFQEHQSTISTQISFFYTSTH